MNKHYCPQCGIVDKYDFNHCCLNCGSKVWVSEKTETKHTQLHDARTLSEACALMKQGK